jgi:hypothetical protein
MGEGHICYGFVPLEEVHQKVLSCAASRCERSNLRCHVGVELLNLRYVGSQVAQVLPDMVSAFRP